LEKEEANDGGKDNAETQSALRFAEKIEEKKTVHIAEFTEKDHYRELQQRSFSGLQDAGF